MIQREAPRVERRSFFFVIERKLQTYFQRLHVLVNAEFRKQLSAMKITRKTLRERPAEDEFKFDIVDSRRQTAVRYYLVVCEFSIERSVLGRVGWEIPMPV
jgi:hypothetical protein